MLSRRRSDPLAFELDPPMLVSSLILFERSRREPVWVAAHERAGVTQEVAAATQFVARENLPPLLPASSEVEGFVELASVPDTSGVELSSFRIGEAPAGFLTVVSVPTGVDVTGKVFTLFVVGARTGFLTFGP